MPTAQRPTERRPLSLLVEAEADANDQHRRRLAELKELAPLLATFEPFRAQLEQRGLKLYPDQVSLRRESSGYSRVRMKQLRLRTDAVFSEDKPERFLAALLELGFTETKRDSSEITLKHGRLQVLVSAPVNRAASAISTAKYAVRTAERAGPQAQAFLAMAAQRSVDALSAPPPYPDRPAKWPEGCTHLPAAPTMSATSQQVAA